MINRSISYAVMALIGITYSQCRTSQHSTGECTKLLLNESYIPLDTDHIDMPNQQLTYSGNKIFLSGDKLAKNSVLIWDGKMAKSYPPIVFLHLDQSGKKQAKKNMCFDISELIERTGKTPLRIQIAGYRQEIMLEK